MVKIEINVNKNQARALSRWITRGINQESSRNDTSDDYLELYHTYKDLKKQLDGIVYNQ